MPNIRRGAPAIALTAASVSGCSSALRHSSGYGTPGPASSVARPFAVTARYGLIPGRPTKPAKVQHKNGGRPAGRAETITHDGPHQSLSSAFQPTYVSPSVVAGAVT